MTKIVDLNAGELNQVVGGVTSSSETDPVTGETVVRDCTGQEIGRYPAGSSVNG